MLCPLFKYQDDAQSNMLKLQFHLHCFFFGVSITFFFHFSPMWAMASSFLRFLDHTHDAPVGRTPVDKLSAHRRDLYRTAHNVPKQPCPQQDLNPQSQQATDLLRLWVRLHSHQNWLLITYTKGKL